MLTWAALSHHAPLRCSPAPVPPHMPNATWLSSMAHALPLHGCWIASPFLERVEWVDLLHCGPERSLSDEVAQLLVHLPDLGARCRAYPIDQPEAVETETTVDELAGRHGRELPTEEGVDDNRAARFERLGQLAHGSSAHRIEDETQCLPVESLFNLLVEVVALEHNAVTSPLPHLVDRVVPADDMQRLDACALRERDDVLPHGRVGGGLADPVAGPQRHVAGEQERGRRRVDPEHGELQGVGVVTHRHDVAHRDDHLVGPCPLLVGRKHQDALTLQSPIDLRSNLGDSANTLRAYRGGESRPEAVEATDEQKVRWIERGRFHRDEHIHLAQSRLGDRVEFDDI